MDLLACRLARENQLSAAHTHPKSAVFLVKQDVTNGQAEVWTKIVRCFLASVQVMSIYKPSDKSFSSKKKKKKKKNPVPYIFNNKD